MFSGSQSRRGKSQSPVTRMAAWKETETLKPIDQAIARMVSESPGRNASERRGGPERLKPRRPSLTVHPIGNPRGAEFGGQPETLVPSAPRWMTAALRGLRREAKGLPYNVTFEATHHGPYLTAPTFYIEQGSTEKEWADLAASRAIARVLLALEPLDAPIAIGLGGGHYVPRHTDLALLRRIAFGHLIAAYALEGGSAHVIDQAVERTNGATLGYIHRKSLSKPEVRTYEEQLEAHGLRVVREADLLTDREDES